MNIDGGGFMNGAGCGVFNFATDGHRWTQIAWVYGFARIGWIQWLGINIFRRKKGNVVILENWKYIVGYFE